VSNVKYFYSKYITNTPTTLNNGAIIHKIDLLCDTYVLTSATVTQQTLRCWHKSPADFV